MKTGLTSVSFRKLSCDEVIALAKESGVDGIEWGSDVHVPQNDIENAYAVAQKTRESGLEVISYGSYFTLGSGEDFSPYIEAAIALGTKQIRIWGGKKERHELSDKEYADLVSEMKKIGEMAEGAGVVVSLEYHQRSITATASDAAKFAFDVDMPSVRLYWQEIIGRPMEDNLADIDIVAPYLTNVHVFNYIDGKQELLETGDGLERWRAYSDKIAKIPGERAFMTEFCKGGLPESFISDAAILSIIAKKSVGNVEHTLPAELVAELKARDKVTKERQWAAFEEKLDAPNKKEIVEALKDFFTIYDEGLVRWMANLYDPDICVCNELYGKAVCEHHPLCGTAGFHYTHSARDNVGYLPVVEAMNSIFDFVCSCGMTDSEHVCEWFGKENGEKMMKFVENLQDPDGFFYHPQWGKNIGLGRRGRDYDRSLLLLKRYGKSPKYPTIDSAKDDANSSALIPEHMKNLEVFKEYLDSLDIDHRSYNAASVLNSQLSQLKARGQEYLDAVYEHFNAHQRADNGIWHEKCDYYGSNGVMKVVCNYTAQNRPVPRPEMVMKSALETIMSPEEPDSIVTVWNPWVTVRRLLINIEQFHSHELAEKIKKDIYKIAPEAIRITKEKTLKFKKPDGSFSYLPEYSTWTMQGAPCAIPRTREGDMDAGVLGTNSMAWVIFGGLGFGNDDGVPIFGEYEAALFRNIMDNRRPVRK